VGENGLLAQVHGPGAEPPPQLHTVAHGDALPARPSVRAMPSFLGLPSSLAASLPGMAERFGSGAAESYAREAEAQEAAARAVRVARLGAGLRSAYADVDTATLLSADLNEHEEMLRAAREGAAKAYAQRLFRGQVQRRPAMVAGRPPATEEEESGGAGESKNGEEALKLGPGEVGFDLAQGRAAGYKFSQRNRSADAPVGPVLILSTAAAPEPSAASDAASTVVATTTPSPTSATSATSATSPTSAAAPFSGGSSLRWRMRAAGNFSLGIVSECPQDYALAEGSGGWSRALGYLSQRGRVGITNCKTDALLHVPNIEG